MRERVAETLRRLVATARAEGRDTLLETEGLEVAEALGLRVPRWRFLRGAKDVADLDLSVFPGEQVVLKVVSPDLLHKSDVGGVRFVPREAGAVTAAVAEMEARLGGESVVGYTVCEYVPHDPSLGGQLLLGMRYTEDFGPVVTFGPGGVHAEFLARNFRPGRDSAILSPLLSSPERIDAALEATAITPAATGRLRGQASRIGLEDLHDLLARLLEFAASFLPDPLEEFEFNPLVWTEHGPTALDALARLGSARPPLPPPRPLERLPHLLRPKSLAIVGVSRGENPGRIILRNVRRQGFPVEAITVIKPGMDEIDGVRCVPDVASLSAPVDLLVVSVDAAQVPGVVEAAIEHERAASMILISGGMGERSGREAPVDRLRAALDRSRSTESRGPLLNGGNCLGVRSLPGRYDTLFIPDHKLRVPEGEGSPVALITQSGAFAVSKASRLAVENPRYLITIGNQVDLTMGDYLTWLAEDDSLEVFACYVEGFRPRDGERWLQAAARITASGRTVLLYRAGRTAAGARATASHTASVAGDYAVTRALAEAAGVLVAETLEDFDDLLRLAVRLRGKTVAGRRVGALSNAGFECVAIADNLAGLQLADWTPHTRALLGGLLAERDLDAIVGVQNPLDLTPIFDDAGYEAAAETILADPGVDVGVIGCVPLSAALTTVPAGPGHEEDLEAPGAVGVRLARLFERSEKAWVAVVDAGPRYDALAALLDRRGVPVFRTADRALRLLGLYVGRRTDRAGP